jgi:hypothetical protein
MKPDNQIQKDDITLPGGLGSVIINGNEGEITQMFKSNEGATTLTIIPKKVIDDPAIFHIDTKSLKSIG